MNTRRSFLKKAAAAAGTLSFIEITNPIFAAELQNKIDKLKHLTPDEAAKDEDFWSWVRESFTVSSTIINLNNGGVSPQPKVVQDAHIQNYQMSNWGPSHFMWHILDQGREPLRAKIALLAGCSPEEIAINRNSTEGLNTIIFGLNLKAGDEVVLSKYDYPNMMNAWKQREKRDGIKLVWVDFDLPIENDKIAVATYTKAITSKTKIVHITHMINWSGQLMPVKAIAENAHARGCEVIVDGAHTFCHIEYKINDLDCDYYATSLHKWACAPFGSGMMYIKKDKIKNVWALLSAPEPDGADIRKFENLGTRNMAAEMAIANALDFHNTIGSARKEARLRYLKNYWCGKITHPKFKLNTSLQTMWSCAIANFSIDGWDAGDIASKLMEKKKIHTVAIKWEKLNGVRVTPHVYTSLADLDKLVEGIKEICEMPVPLKK
jgi:selenocysteine lyase/cysteine desulfurase